MDISLHDCRILVTRPLPQGLALCDYLRHCGADVIHFPTIAFAPPADIDAFQQALTLLGEQDWLLFNSPQAVYASASAILQRWPSYTRFQIAAIGVGTAKALTQAGFKNVIYPSESGSSEQLLAMSFLQQLEGKKIAIIRGEGGREKLEGILQARGAQVLTIIAYKRIIPTIATEPIIHLLKEKALNAIVCTSYEGVHHLKIQIGEAAWPDLRDIPLVVISARIKILAEDLGFRTIWLAQHAGPVAIATVIATMRKSHD